MIDAVQFYKCLADATRLKILLLIYAKQELCVCELTSTLNESQPKVSRHLALLRKHQLLTDRRQGQWIYYQLNNQLPSWCIDNLSQALAGNSDFIAPYLTQLQSINPEQACC